MDVSSLSCTAALSPAEANIVSAVVLDEPCYDVRRSLVVGAGGSLTVSPGTVLRFAPGTGLTVGEGGSLSARGTSAAPIVLTGAERSPGSWTGVSYQFSASAGNVLENVVLEYGGSDIADGAALTADTAIDNPVRLSLQSVLIRSSGGYAFNFEAGTMLDRFAGVVATDNRRSAQVTIDLIDQLSSANSYAGNDSDGIRLVGNVETASAWNRIDVPWVIGSMQVNAPLTIAAGSTVQFDAGGRLVVNATGSLTAIGTAEAPIQFSGALASAGYWNGLHLNVSDSAGNQLEHVVIEHAGADPQLPGGLSTSTNSGQRARVSLRDVTFRNNAGPGFLLDDNTRLTQFENIVSTVNGSAGRVNPALLGVFGSNLSLAGNTDDSLLLSDVVLVEPLTMPALDVPYRFGAIDVDAPLTLAPGSRLVAQAGGRIRITDSGSLTARGTIGEPVVFEGSAAVAGHWRGLLFSNAGSPANLLDQMVIRDAGGLADGTGGSVSTGAVVLLCSEAAPTALAISNARIENSAGWGVYLSSPACRLTLGPAAVFSNNVAGDVNRR